MYVMKNIFYFVFFYLCLGYSQAQEAPAKLWDKTFGGNGNDQLFDIITTPDGGYLLGGLSWSSISGDRTVSNRGSSDYWIVKVDNEFNKEWDKRYGGSAIDDLRAMAIAPDGGYLLGGFSHSDTNGDKSENNRQERDYWIIKIDNQGNKIWDRTLGGNHIDFFDYILPLPEGGYLLAGWSRSTTSNERTAASKGGADIWAIKIDNQGNIIWNKAFGGSDDEFLTDIDLTPDGNYILSGHSESGISGDKSTSNLGGRDCWFVKIDPEGNKIWDKSFGGNAHDNTFRLMVDTDGGFTFTAQSFSGISPDKTEANRGSGDFWVVKLDENGNKIWDRTLGGTGDDSPFEIIRTPDNGILVTGYSTSGIGFEKSEANQGSEDFWVVKLDENGNKIWDKTFGGSFNESARKILIAPDNGYIVTGYSASGQNEDKSSPNKGGTDYWVVRLDAEINFPPIVANPLENITLSGCNLPPIDIDLSTVFDDTDDNNESIIKAIVNPNEVTRLSPIINGNILQLNPKPGAVETIELIIEGLSGDLVTYDTVEVSLNIQPVPQPEILGSSSTCSDKTSIYTVESEAGHSYYWQIIPEDTPVQTQNNTTQIEFNWANQSGKIVLIDSIVDISCVGYDTLEVKTLQTKVALPEMFSPNQDEQNDHFYVLLPDQTAPIQELDLKIYNLDGWKVYETQNIEEATNSQRGWDGDNYPPGMYLYTLTLGFGTCEKQTTLKGAVKLIR